MEGSGNSHRDICRDGGSSGVDAERCGDADTDSVGREEVDRALQEADQEGRREEHCRETARDSAVDACCLSHRTPLSSRMTTCDLHCSSPEWQT